MITTCSCVDVADRGHGRRSWAGSGPIAVVSGRTGVRAKDAIPLRAPNSFTALLRRSLFGRQLAALDPLLPFKIVSVNGRDAPRSGHSENKLRTGRFDPECHGRGRPCSSTSAYRLALFNKGAAHGSEAAFAGLK
jgi:hypothetical protein